MVRPLNIFISVCEDSADVHAAALMRAAAEHLPGARFQGLTGPRLRALGADTVYDFAQHAAMLGGVIGLIGRARQAMHFIKRSWQQRRPDVVVLLDSPEFHLRVAKRAKAHQLPVLFYIAPQTWASRAGRNRQIARDIDALACILPFEERYFHEHGVPQARYVGHPLVETLARQAPDHERVRAIRAAGRPVIALLPGSRRHVISGVLPLQMEVLRELGALGCHPHVAISAVDDDRAAHIQSLLGLQKADAQIVTGDNASLLAAADLVLVASGTATLEVAYYRRPMIVMYEAGWLLGEGHRWVGRWVVKTPHMSLVNILAGKRVVPEFMPRVDDPGAVAQTAAELLRDEIWRRQMQKEFDTLLHTLSAGSASGNVCRLIAEMTKADAHTAAHS